MTSLTLIKGGKYYEERIEPATSEWSEPTAETKADQVVEDETESYEQKLYSKIKGSLCKDS